MKINRNTRGVDVLLEEEIQDSPVAEPGMRVENPGKPEIEKEIPIQEETQESTRCPTRNRSTPDRFTADAACRTYEELPDYGMLGSESRSGVLTCNVDVRGCGALCANHLTCESGTYEMRVNR